MPSRIRCPRCGTDYRVNESVLGRRVVCKRCRLEFIAPTETDRDATSASETHHSLIGSIGLQAAQPQDSSSVQQPRAEPQEPIAGSLTATLQTEGQAGLLDRPAGSRWFVGWRRKQMTPGLVVTIVGMTVLAALAYPYARTRWALLQVERLRQAEIGQVASIIERLAPCRDIVLSRLEELSQQPDLPADERLRFRLALATDNRQLVAYLRDGLLHAEPAKFLTIRAALQAHATILAPAMWEVVNDVSTEPSHRFRAACALAAFDPDNWDKLIHRTAARLVQADPLDTEMGLEALRPVSKKLIAPLIAILRDRGRPEFQRTKALWFLHEYEMDSPEYLVELVCRAGPNQLIPILPKLRPYGVRAAKLLEEEYACAAASHPPTGTREDNQRLINAVAALLLLGYPDAVWSALKHTPDPSVRSRLIHGLATMGVDSQVVIGGLNGGVEVSVRRALILALGEFDNKMISADVKRQLSERMCGIYRSDPDAGIHGAAEWSLRQWGEERRIRQIDRELAAVPLAGGRQWFVTSEGHCMVIIRGPVEFLMGSPGSETGRDRDETQHRRRIARSYAMASKTTTVEQYRTFLSENPRVQRVALLNAYRPTDNCPQAGISWDEAAAYCNWISAKEGIPEYQWCYEKKTWLDNSAHMVPTVDMLRRKGYRLPTEAEWEYACRAGAQTSRFFGDAEGLLTKYAWFRENALGRSWPVGTLKPNDFGLFDMLGNVWQCCHDEFANYRVPVPAESTDDEDASAPFVDNRRVVRGGTFYVPASSVRSAYRYWLYYPDERRNVIGFRVAKTCE